MSISASNRLKTAASQRGVVLIVSLMFLLMVMIVGFSVIKTSSLESRMATSREIKEQTFQAAEASIEQALDDLPFLSSAYAVSLEGTENWPEEDYSFTHDAKLEGAAEVQFLNIANTKGYSVRKGASGIATYYYEVTGNGSREDSRINSVHTQGVYVEGPRLN